MSEPTHDQRDQFVRIGRGARPPTADDTVATRERIEIGCALCLMAAGMLFAFAFVPEDPRLMPVVGTCFVSAAYLFRLGHARRMGP